MTEVSHGNIKPDGMEKPLMTPLERKRILLIDDDDDHLFLTKIKLERLNEEFDVDVAKSAEEGLEKLRTKEFDCVISDYNMRPGMNGLELLQTLQHADPEIPTILVSTGDRSGIENSLSQAEGIEFIQKSTGDHYIESITKYVKRAIADKEPKKPLSALEQRLNEVELQSLRYRTFFHAAREIGILLGLDGKTIEELNASAAGLFGSTEKNLGSNILLHVHHQDRLAMSQLILNILSGRREQDIIRFMLKDGLAKRLRVGGACVRAAGQVTGVVLYGTEVLSGGF